MNRKRSERFLVLPGLVTPRSPLQKLWGGGDVIRQCDSNRSVITQFIKAVVDVDGSSDVNFRYLIISCVIDPSQSSKIEKSAI